MKKKFYRDLDEINENEEIEFTRDDIFDQAKTIHIANHFFVLTGTFTSGKRDTIKSLIEENGGIVKTKLTKDIDYLIVGEVTSNGWKYRNYGTKIEQALVCKKQGYKIKIIPEQVLMKSLKDQKSNDEKGLIEAFLKVNPISYRKEIHYKTLEEKIIYFDDIVDDFEDALMKALKSRVKYFNERIREIRYFYEQLPKDRKERLQDELEQKLRNYVNKSLAMNFKSIKDEIASAKRKETKIRRLKKELENLKKMFGEFAQTQFVKTKINEFVEDIKKEIENE